MDVAGETRFGAAIVAHDERLAARDLVAAVRDRLSAFKMPKLWLLLDYTDDLPRKTSGKIDKAALRMMIESKGTVAD